jgi:hypothetical protein
VIKNQEEIKIMDEKFANFKKEWQKPQLELISLSRDTDSNPGTGADGAALTSRSAS